MAGTRKLAGVIAETVATLEAALVAAADGLMSEALLELERRVQRIVREVGGVLVSGVLGVRAQGAEGEAGCCPHCAGRLHLVGRERERTLLGLVGEYRFARPTFYCVQWRRGHTPLDAALGLGQVQLAPALAQVVSREAVQVAFAQAGANVQASLGVAVDGETVRRLAEAPGALVEQAQADRAQWAVPPAAVPASLLVEFDGVQTPLTDGYHELKVGRVAALGPDLQEDPRTGRSTLVLGPPCFCAGVEAVAACYPRLTREAWRAGFTRGVERVVVLADGAKWIWHQAHTQFSQPGVEVIEIVDFYQATEHLAEVATALHGAGTLAATAWFADHKQADSRRYYASSEAAMYHRMNRAPRGSGSSPPCAIRAVFSTQRQARRTSLAELQSIAIVGAGWDAVTMRSGALPACGPRPGKAWTSWPRSSAARRTVFTTNMTPSALLRR